LDDAQDPAAVKRSATRHSELTTAVTLTDAAAFASCSAG